AASQAIDPVFLQTPQYRSEGLSRLIGAAVLCKLESANPIGCFKGRGADWWMQSSTPGRRVVCASAGNFGQALAYAARRLEREVTVFAACSANPAKLEAMRNLGADVRTYGEDFDEAKDEAARYAAAQGALYVEDGREDEIAEGAGSIAVEILAGEAVDAIYVPVGNGALANGVGSWGRQHSPQTRVVGVCAEGAPSMERSWRSGEAVATDAVSTIADGVATREPIAEALAHFAEVVDDVVLVSDGEIVAAMRALFEHERLVTEPAGAVSLAGLLNNCESESGRLVATLVTGSNIDPRRRNEWLGA
ncbi:MAG: pyridoxal-phosphate dependent enzyme, partial [Acidobacteria bacterium]|nr:pyridoxal-phosphate dependent enzyme [Acidobacteriota bacterium]